MTLRQTREAIAATVREEIPTLHCHSFPPDTIVTPALFVGASRRAGNETYDPTHKPTLDVIVAVARTQEHWADLDEFCEPVGARSVQAALEMVDGLTVEEVEQAGAVEIGGAMFYGAAFTCTVWL